MTTGLSSTTRPTHLQRSGGKEIAKTCGKKSLKMAERKAE